MTEDQRSKIKKIVMQMRQKAHHVGSMHAWWDIIFDLEAVLHGRDPILKMSVDEWIDYAEAAMKPPTHINGKPVLRCSGLDQFLSCPGSRTLLEALGSMRTDDSASHEGNWCHHQGAKKLVEEHGAVPPAGGLPPPEIPDGYNGSDFAKWMVEYYTSRVLQDAGGDRAMEVECELLAEFDRFWLSGHCDSNTVNAEATELSFNDLKTGINKVDLAEANWQCLGYATLFKKQWPTLKKIRGRIIQPRLIENRESDVTIEGEQLENAPAFLGAKINAALDAPMKLNAGQKQCRWCDVGLRCPELRKKLKSKNMEITHELLEKLKTEPNDQVLAEWCVAGKLLLPKLEEAKDLMRERLAIIKELVLADGTRLFLQDKAGRREVVNKQAAWHKLAGKVRLNETTGALEFEPGALDESEALECVTIKIGEVEKILARKHGLPVYHKKGDSGKLRAEELLAGTVEQQPTTWLIIE